MSVIVFIGCGGSPSSPPAETPPPVDAPVETPPTDSGNEPDPVVPPVAVNDQAIVRQNSTDNSIDVLDNDLPSDGVTLSLQSVVPHLGSAQVEHNRVLYSPLFGFVGAETLSYVAASPGGYLVEAELEVVVIGESGVTLRIAWDLGNTGDLSQYLISQRNMATPFLETITAFDNDGSQRIYLNITSGGEYQFRVAAVDGTGERSDWSDTVNQFITF